MMQYVWQSMDKEDRRNTLFARSRERAKDMQIALFVEKLIIYLANLRHVWNAYFAICTYDSRVCGEHVATKITLFRDIELPVIHLFHFRQKVSSFYLT